MDVAYLAGDDGPLPHHRGQHRRLGELMVRRRGRGRLDRFLDTRDPLLGLDHRLRRGLDHRLLRLAASYQEGHEQEGADPKQRRGADREEGHRPLPLLLST